MWVPVCLAIERIYDMPGDMEVKSKGARFCFRGTENKSKEDIKVYDCCLEM